LIASDLGHIAHLFRRFHGGGPNGFSQTNDAGNYSKHFPGNRTFAGIRRARSGRRQKGGAKTPLACETQVLQPP
jgi:hypothetical protein